jgi:hypothetical protein
MVLHLVAKLAKFVQQPGDKLLKQRSSVAWNMM